MTFPIDINRELYKFYGIPDRNADGSMDQAWVDENIVRIVPPYQMFMTWNQIPVKTIRVHRKVQSYLLKSLQGIGREFSSADISKYGLNQFGGCLCEPRHRRGGDRLSMHSFGAAIDLAPDQNRFGRIYQKDKDMMPMKAVEIFKDQGAKWGGMFRPTPDAMHFEWTS